MPVVKTFITDRYSVFLWEISENEEYLINMAHLNEGEKHFIDTIQNKERKHEWLAVRACVRENISKELDILYNNIGAPMLSDGRKISISHTKGYAAVMLSESSCGLDIEQLDRKFGYVASKFSTEKERSYLGSLHLSEKELLGVIWCCKEAAYKWCGRDGIDFNRDFIMKSVSEDTAAVEYAGGELLLRHYVYSSIIIAFTDEYHIKK